MKLVGIFISLLIAFFLLKTLISSNSDQGKQSNDKKPLTEIEPDGNGLDTTRPESVEPDMSHTIENNEESPQPDEDEPIEIIPDVDTKPRNPRLPTPLPDQIREPRGTRVLDDLPVLGRLPIATMVLDSLQIDPRDGKTYRTVKIGSQVWMAENLAFKPNRGNYWTHNNSSDMAKYGYFYDWQTACNVCPAGWHLPSDAEWTQLTDFVGSNPGTKLKAKSGWIRNGTDDYGFSALPGGGYNVLRRQITSVGSNGIWWSSSEYNDNSAWRRIMSSTESTDSVVTRALQNKPHGRSVRCIRD